MNNGMGLQRSLNDSPRDGSLHGIALRQLEAWDAIAWEWPCYQDGEGYIRCRECSQAIARTRDDGNIEYEISSDQILALTVAHLRQRHSEVANGID